MADHKKIRKARHTNASSAHGGIPNNLLKPCPICGVGPGAHCGRWSGVTQYGGARFWKELKNPHPERNGRTRSERKQPREIEHIELAEAEPPTRTNSYKRRHQPEYEWVSLDQLLEDFYETPRDY